MRVRSHWFKSERPKSPREVAGALAFIAWRVAQQVLKNMRRADFEIDAGPKYFEFLAEWLIFLVHVADRMAFERLGPDVRIDFTTALANRAGEIYGDNRDELLPLGGDEPPGTTKSRFIDLLNLRLADYADFEFRDGVDYACLRYLAERLVFAVGPRDAVWVHEQVMEIEAPQAVETICKSLRDLLDDQPRTTSRRATEQGE
jgi:hypothetical protein